MIIRRETINMIATYRYKGYTPATIAQLMNIAVAGVYQLAITSRPVGAVFGA